MALGDLTGGKHAGVKIQGAAAREQVRRARALDPQHGIAMAHVHDCHVLPGHRFAQCGFERITLPYWALQQAFVWTKPEELAICAHTGGIGY
jgi:hypothetical protein